MKLTKLASLVIALAMGIANYSYAQTQTHGVTLNVNAVGVGSTSTCFYSSLTSGGPYTKISCVSNSALPFFIPVTNSNSGITDFFVATGLNSIGESGFSNEKSATFPLLPQPPTNLSVQSQ